MLNEKPKVLALDLEGTLISNAVSQIPRPFLFEFLESCFKDFPRVVMYTSVKEETFRVIARRLVEEGHAPVWFESIEYVHWHGPTKDLSFIPGCRPEEALLVDDYAGYVHPGQATQWIEVNSFDYDQQLNDNELERIALMLCSRAAGPKRTIRDPY